MRLFLTEKPDQAKVVSRGLGGATPADGYHRCGPDVVTWCRGHLLMPKMPEDYDPALKQWAWETLPIIPAPFAFKPRQGAGKQLNVIKSLLSKASEVVVATDADREGELIAYEVLTFLKWRGDTRRLWLSDLTPAAVKKALGEIRPGAETKPLYYAAFARMCGDFLVGLNMTRAATLKLRAPGAKGALSIGRVQTPTLALVVRLERKIRDFKPETYYELVATVRTEHGHVVKMRFSPPPEKRIKDRSRIDAGRAQAQGQRAPISVETAQKNQQPPELLDLNRLQQEANRRFGFSADRTLQLAQALYESQFLTYPRTDSTALPEEHVERIPTILSNLANVSPLSQVAASIQKPIVRKQAYDDARVTAHHAIAPTLQPCDLDQIEPDQQKVYLLVARHYLAAHMPDYEFTATAMRTKPGGVPFRVNGTVPLKEGWRVAFSGVPDEADDTDADAEGSGELPPIRDGETGVAEDVQVEEKQTKPPNRYTEATLLRGMRNIASEVDDPDAKKRLKATSGIGTPATRAGIIETLKTRNFITLKKKQVLPTDTGMGLIAALEASLPDYADPTVTAQWEDVLEEIAGGRSGPKEFVNAIAQKVKADVQSLHGREDLPMFGAGGEKLEGEAKRAAQARQAEAAARPKIDWKKRRQEAIERGRRLKVPFEQRETAKKLGAIWDGENKVWILHPDTDPQPFLDAGLTLADE